MQRSHGPVLPDRAEISADPALAELHAELLSYVPPDDYPAVPSTPTYGDLVIPIHLRTDAGVLSFFTTTVFGAVHDITLSELAIESFYPADQATTEAYNRHT